MRALWGVLSVLCACGFHGSGEPAAVVDAADDPRPKDARLIDAPVDAPKQRLYGGPVNQLFAIDPDTFTEQLIDDFKMGGSNLAMEDIARDRQGALVGIDTAFESLYAIDPATAACTKLADLPDAHGYVFRGLAFGYPGGVETLYGGTGDGELLTIDRATGALTLIGSFGNNLVTAGDVAWVPGLELVVGATQSGAPKLVRPALDTGTGTILGDMPTAMLGLGVIDGKFYGFGSNGRVYELSATGSAMRERQTAINWAHAAP